MGHDLGKAIRLAAGNPSISSHCLVRCRWNRRPAQACRDTHCGKPKANQKKFPRSPEKRRLRSHSGQAQQEKPHPHARKHDRHHRAGFPRKSMRETSPAHELHRRIRSRRVRNWHLDWEAGWSTLSQPRRRTVSPPALPPSVRVSRTRRR